MTLGTDTVEFRLPADRSATSPPEARGWRATKSA